MQTNIAQGNVISVNPAEPRWSAEEPGVQHFVPAGAHDAKYIMNLASVCHFSPKSLYMQSTHSRDIGDPMGELTCAAPLQVSV